MPHGAHADFTRVVDRLMKDRPVGGTFIGVSYIDLKSMAGFVLDNLAPWVQSLVPTDIPVDAAQLPTTDAITRHLFGGAAVSWHVADGYLGDIYSPTGFVAPVLGMAVGAGLAFYTVAGRRAETQRDMVEIRELMRDQSRAAKARADLLALKSAVMLFKLNEGRLPNEGEWPEFLVNGSENHKEPYIDASHVERGMVLDPWHNPYGYRKNSAKAFEIKSYGADGQPGGEGLNADLTAR